VDFWRIFNNLSDSQELRVLDGNRSLLPPDAEARDVSEERSEANERNCVDREDLPAMAELCPRHDA
jgi:hypothetical protein